MVLDALLAAAVALPALLFVSLALSLLLLLLYPSVAVFYQS